MKKFEKITRVIPILESEEKHSEWIADVESKEAMGNPVRAPFVDYCRSEMLLSEAVHECVFDLQDEMDVRRYMDVLESYGIDNEEKILATDVSTCDAKCTLAMITAIVRQDRICEGLLLKYLENGKMLEWMKHLAEIDGL